MSEIESRISYEEKLFAIVEIGADEVDLDAQLVHRIDYYDDPEGVHYYYLEISEGAYQSIKTVIAGIDQEQQP